MDVFLAAVLSPVVIIVAYFVILLTGDCDLETRFASDPPPGAFKGKLALVVGASSGIGAEVAKKLARGGAKVILAARREAELRRVAAECEKAGAEAVVQVLDVLQFDAHKDLLEQMTAEHGTIDILVANAGRTQRSCVEETSVSVDRAMMDLNVIGMFSIVKAALPSMLANGGGDILVTSSVAGIVPAPVSSTYSASKHALQGFFKTLRAELGSRGINVTLACPGPVDTPIAENAFTGTTGVAYGETSGNVKDNTVRMSAERCAQLMVRGMYRRIAELWLSPNPILLFTALSHYAPPGLAAKLAVLVGPRRVNAFKQGQHGYESIQSVGGILRGSTKEE